MRKLIFAIVILTAPTAYADDDPGDTNTQNPPSHADPANKTLPTTASAKAQANAFGQQGARMRAAHQAAKAAAADQARQAAATHKPATAGTPNAHANAHAAGASAASHAATGLDRAATASGGRVHHP
jgi:hypothetical protein